MQDKDRKKIVKEREEERGAKSPESRGKEKGPVPPQYRGRRRERRGGR